MRLEWVFTVSLDKTATTRVSTVSKQQFAAALFLPGPVSYQHGNVTINILLSVFYFSVMSATKSKQM